jgi:acyl transferase domain-containing protein
VIDRIGVVGVGCRLPGGSDGPERFCASLDAAGDGMVPVPAGRWDDQPDTAASGHQPLQQLVAGFLDNIADWDATLFGVTPQEAWRIDPQHRLLLDVGWRALEDAAINPADLRGTRTGIFVGVTDSQQYIQVQRECDPACTTDPYMLTGSSPSMAAGRLSYFLDTRGPTVTVDTACSSALVAIHLAFESLARHECDLAVVAAASALVYREVLIGTYQTGMVARDGRCKPFDRRADGFTLGEGAGAVVLERLDDAVAHGRRVRATARGSAMNHDGRSNGLTAPNRAAQVAVLRAALDRAATAPEEVAFVEAHGSATALGDAIELQALGEVFGERGDRPLYVGAVKSNVGHLLAAAGMAGFIKTVLALDHRRLPPNLHFQTPNPILRRMPWLVPPACPVDLFDEPLVAGVSSFGWSGTNAHIVLERAPSSHSVRATPEAGPYVLTLGATSPSALDRFAADLADHLESDKPRLADVAHTLHRGRSGHRERRAVVCADAAEAIRRCREPRLSGPARASDASNGRVGFLFPGIGDVEPGTAAALLPIPTFAAAMDACRRVFAELDVDIDPVLVCPGPDERSPQPSLAALLGRAPVVTPDDAPERIVADHAALFAIEYSLAELLLDAGVEPAGLLGYSLGEYVAAAVAGVFDLDVASRIVAARARLVAALPVGGMLAVAAPADALVGWLDDIHGVSIAAFNGPAMTVVAGERDGLGAVESRCEAADVACQWVRTSHAFHTPHLAPAQAELARVVAGSPRHAPRVPLISNVTGAPIDGSAIQAPEYWARHLCEPVQFADGARSLAGRAEVMAEVGPGNTLAGLVRAATADDPVTVAQLLRSGLDRGRDDRSVLYQGVACLWAHGATVDWTKLGHPAGRVVTLPPQAFEPVRHWPVATAPARVSPVTTGGPDSGGLHSYARTWRQVIALGSAPVDGGTVVLVSDAPEASPLADHLRSAGWRVATIEAPVSAALGANALRAVVASAADEAPLHVVECGMLDRRAGSTTEQARGSLDRLLVLVQAVSRLVYRGPRSLIALVAGASSVVGHDAGGIADGAVVGLCRAVRTELPSLRCRVVDVDRAAPPATIGGQLAIELSCLADDGPADGCDDLLVAWRNGRRWVAEWSPVIMGAAEPPWRTGGVYMITGGTRGLGLAVAKHVAAHRSVKLVLVGRTPLPPPEKWDTVLAGSNPDDDHVRTTITGVRDLETLGAEVDVLIADLSDEVQATAVLADAAQRFGRLDGVIHCAGIPSTGLIENTTVAAVRPVVDTKVSLLPALRTAIERHELDLVVLYSSAVTALGGIGEVEYAAANACLEAFTDAHTDAGTRVLAVAWGPWQHNDWGRDTTSSFAEQSRQYRTDFGIGLAAGLVQLDRLLASGVSVALTLGEPIAQARARWSALTDIDTLAALRTAGPVLPRPDLRAAFAPPRTQLQEHLADIWRDALGLELVGIDDPFFELGGTSLVGVSVVRRIERDLGMPLLAGALFEHPTIRELAAALDADNAGSTADTSGATGAAERGRRRHERSARLVKSSVTRQH